MSLTQEMTPTPSTLPARGTAVQQRWVAGAFRGIALLECLTWVGMLTSLLFKYVINGNALGVTIFGWAHGITWLLFLASALAAALVFRWKIWVFLLGCAVSTLPFLTWPFELWMVRSGQLRISG